MSVTPSAPTLRQKPPLTSGTRPGPTGAWGAASPCPGVYGSSPARRAATTASGATEGEISLDLSDRPVGLMTRYHGDPDRTAEAMAGGYYRTGDIGSRDEDGYITYVSPADDVLMASRAGVIPFQMRLSA